MKRKIHDFKIYNYDDWTLNCREKSLYTILMNFNINPMILMLDSVCYYSLENNILSQKSILMGDSFEKRYEEVGLKRIAKQNCKDIVSEVRSSIDLNRPAVINIDWFYDRIRTDSYKKNHGYNFILAFGYDDDKQIFNIIDHNDANNYYYEEYEISFSEMKIWYEGYLDCINHEDYDSFFSYYKEIENSFLPEFYYQKKNFDTLKVNIDKCLNGITDLDKYISFFKRCLNDSDKFLKNFDLIYESIRVINLDILKRNFTDTNIFKGHPFINKNLSEISNNWKFIKALFDKFMILPVKFPIERFNKCEEKLKRISVLEKENYLEIKRIGNVV